ncbi:MAG: hypothetical protein KDB21_20075 [Acidimicrobiales bacterium]|nr:hypothetical protein [Acidimicrobiales bacterium]
MTATTDRRLDVPRAWIDESARRSNGTTLSLVALSGAIVVGVALLGVAATSGPVVGFLALGVAVAVAIVVARPETAGVILVGILPAVSGIARGFPIPGLRISELLVAFCGFVALTVGRDHDAPRWSAVEWSLLAYAVTTLVMGAIGVYRNAIPAGYDTIAGLIGPFQFVLLLRAVTVSLGSPDRRRSAMQLLVLTSIPVSLLAIAQYFKLLGVDTTLEQFTSDQFAYFGGFLEARATGPFEHWHLLAGYLLVVELVAVDALLQGGRWLARPLLWLSVLLGVAAMLLTLTFTTFLMGVAAVVVIAFIRGQATRVVAVGASLLIPLFFLFAPYVGGRIEEQFTPASTSSGTSFVPESIAYRFNVWGDEYLPALKGRVLLGYGSPVPPDVGWPYAESLYIELLLRGGLFLLLAYVAYTLLAVGAGRRGAARDEPALASAGLAVAVLMVLLIPMHTVFPYFSTTGLPHALVAVTGVLLAGIGTRTGRDLPVDLR